MGKKDNTAIPTQKVYSSQNSRDQLYVNTINSNKSYYIEHQKLYKKIFSIIDSEEIGKDLKIKDFFVGGITYI